MKSSLKKFDRSRKLIGKNRMLAVAQVSRFASQANFGAAEVKARSAGRRHKPRNLAKSVTVE